MDAHFKTLKPNNKSYWLTLLALVILVALGYNAAHTMEVEGHWITGMNNQIVWGLPHVFAILLILAASGAINVASLSSVFGKKDYNPWARLSTLIAISLLIGGLIILVLDLGRPERLIVAITHYNFKSIFAWNIFLYVGFILIAIVYLFTMFERHQNKHIQKTGVLILIWRFILTSGTGSIFGFLVARQLYDAAIMIPVFIALSLVLGTAFFILISQLTSHWIKEPIDQALQVKLIKLLGLFITLQLFLVSAFHLTNLYTAEHQAVEKFILTNGGIYTTLFWLGQILIGAALPLYLIFCVNQSIQKNLMIATLAIIGGLSQLYVTIIGGQAFPQQLFPGKQVTSTFYDGVVASYTPSHYELLLGLGGLSLAILLIMLVSRVLPFHPDESRRPTIKPSV